MNLRDTVEMMNSEDYKERFRAEYQQLKTRYDKSDEMTMKYDAGTLNFNYKGGLKAIEKQDAYSEYMVKFSGHEGIDEIKFKVKKIDRPNGADDIDLIREYILDNYGYKDYEIINIELIEEVIL